MNNTTTTQTTTPTTARNWQEIIANLQEFSEMGQGTIEAAKRYNDFFKTAEQLQALMNNNGTEAEKEAFFAPIESTYFSFVQTQTRLKEAMARDEEKARKLREQEAARKAEAERWNNLPFYAKDKFSDLICIESRETLEDKFFAISCMLDNLKALPNLLEMGVREEGKDSITDRLAEISKLYLLFADEQFSLLANEIQSGKYGKLDLNGTAKNKGDLC
ncbi:hypothetical protein [Mannheimia haemolytica]|uniref:hypothetical protein n=1 Tax=Mannheimia haemolytica TaxID=75985 RepID=UPI0003869DB4|nr:hypothetical protein [Mannheimia haemolytica]EPY99250.1 hypothetical protein L278_10745 [Mannheimia haemolytica D35]TRC50587.1 hypothetical protein FEA40_01105 [Mannheimia haemolytica]TRC50885.1 hypothetical protein FEA32_01105 [Mannheimia haemolytica]